MLEIMDDPLASYKSTQIFWRLSVCNIGMANSWTDGINWGETHISSWPIGAYTVAT